MAKRRQCPGSLMPPFPSFLTIPYSHSLRFPCFLYPPFSRTFSSPYAFPFPPHLGFPFSLPSHSPVFLYLSHSHLSGSLPDSWSSLRVLTLSRVISLLRLEVSSLSLPSPENISPFFLVLPDSGWLSPGTSGPDFVVFGTGMPGWERPLPEPGREETLDSWCRRIWEPRRGTAPSSVIPGFLVCGKPRFRGLCLS